MWTNYLSLEGAGDVERIHCPIQKEIETLHFDFTFGTLKHPLSTSRYKVIFEIDELS